MAKRFDLCGLGNGIVDIFLPISDADLAKFGFERGSMRLVEASEQEDLIKLFNSREPRLASGGSVANSVIAFAQLGGKAAFLCTLGDDRYGLHYEEEFARLDIHLSNPLIVSQRTGTSLILVTPDAERTMRTHLGAATLISKDFVDEQVIADSKWLFIEGYLFSNPENGQSAIERAVECAKRHDTKIAVTFSEAWVIQAFGDALRSIVAKSDLVFSNAPEAVAFTGEQDTAVAFEKLAKIVPNVVVTRGSEDALIFQNGVRTTAKSFPCKPVDLTGAGDMFAGAFLYGMLHGYKADDAGKRASYLAMKVISQVGARLHTGVREGWTECP